jgi:hypothetical protein
MILSIAGSFFSSCKKGEEDPALSFRSRNSRFEGNWKITLIDITSTRTTGGVTETNTLEFNGNSLNHLLTTNGVETRTTMQNYNMILEINKNDKFTFSQSYSLNDSTKNQSYTTNWNWLNTEKTLVNLPLNFGSFAQCDNWHLRELREKKLVLIAEIKLDQNNLAYPYTYQINYQLEFEKVK